MKKKAIISTVAGLALAGVMCVGFAACGGGSGAKGVAGEEVDETTWDAAFSDESLKNFKAEIEVTNVQDYGKYSYEGVQNMNVQFVNDDQHIVMKGSGKSKGTVPAEMKEYLKESSVNLDYYYNGENGRFIDEVDKTWQYVSASSAAPYTEGYDILEMAIPSDDYADYKYSADDKGYVLKSAKAGESPVVKFKNGKLKAVYYSIVREQSGSKTTTTISVMFTFGGQSFTLPTVG